MVGDVEIVFSDSEHRLLAALMQRAGHVVSKRSLLVEVWGDAGGDAHTVEVAVARLRRRLGAHSEAIGSVRGRGYVLRE